MGIVQECCPAVKGRRGAGHPCDVASMQFSWTVASKLHGICPHAGSERGGAIAVAGQERDGLVAAAMAEAG